MLVACGGSDGPAAAPPGTMIGAAGGTVSAAGGAQVVVPPGALAADTAIAVAASSAGSPPLPAGLITYGVSYAFTPHGTTFAVPVTITVPFDASMVPAGVTPVLYKTSAAGTWEAVPGAIVNAGTITAQVSSFSWLIVGNPLPAAATGLNGTWISTYHCTGSGGTFDGEDTLTVTQNGSSVTFTSQPDAGTFSGTLTGNTMSYAGGAPGYTETGTWTLLGPDSFSKTSNYVRTDGSGGGSCPGTGQRQP
jgi:hypothetical protein